MKSTQQLANRLEETILNGTWVANTNYKDQLNDLDWKIATTKIEPLNTISVLAQHIHYYTQGILEVFKGGTLDISDTYSFDFPPITSQNEWNNFLSRFWNDTEQLIKRIKELPEDSLNHVFVDKKYGTYLRNINGMIEHSYYHLGQIVLIKKMLSNRN